MAIKSSKYRTNTGGQCHMNQRSTWFDDVVVNSIGSQTFFGPVFPSLRTALFPVQCVRAAANASHPHLFTQSATCKIRLQNAFLYWLIKIKCSPFVVFVFRCSEASAQLTSADRFGEIVSAILLICMDISNEKLRSGLLCYCRLWNPWNSNAFRILRPHTLADARSPGAWISTVLFTHSRLMIIAQRTTIFGLTRIQFWGFDLQNCSAENKVWERWTRARKVELDEMRWAVREIRSASPVQRRCESRSHTQSHLTTSATHSHFTKRFHSLSLSLPVALWISCQCAI